MSASASARLWYVHDPMCSWCWGYRETWARLQQKLHGTVSVNYLLGGLAADNQQVMPLEMQQSLQQTWRRVAQHTGARFNFDFWRLNQPRRSTYSSCRAVIAAQQQQAEKKMLLVIQQAYYLQARNPSEFETLVALADEIGLEPDQFRLDLLSASTEQELQRQIKQSQSLPIQGFPSLVLEIERSHFELALDYRDESTTLSQIEFLLEQHRVE